MKKQTKLIIAAAVLLVLVVGAIFLSRYFAPKSVEGAKTVTVEVIHADGTQKDFTIKTDAEFLRGALEQEKLVSGEESQYGLFIQTVDGETADSALEQWWCITKGGEMLMTGADDTPVADGEHYELTLTTGYGQ